MWTHRRSGQHHQRSIHDHRDPFERDSTRVIHCPSFRRLQRKTQVLGSNEGDFHRTRLTHSLEVASIGRSIVHHLKRNYDKEQCIELLPSDDLISVICLIHDIGHPPFGHGGEVALNYMMRDHGGFEGNGQTLRLLTKIEDSYGEYGVDLTRRSLLGILKYPVSRVKIIAEERPQEGNKTIRINDWIPPKAYFDTEENEIEWLVSPFTHDDKQLFQSLATKPDGKKHGTSAYRNFDCSVMEIADDIAYGVHDLEDAIYLQLIHPEQLINEPFQTLLANTPLAQNKEQFSCLLFSQETHYRKQVIGELVNYFITATTIITTNPSFENNLLKYNVVLKPEAKALLEHLKTCVYDFVIDSHAARTFEHGGQKVVLHLFEAINANRGELLDSRHRELFYQAQDEKTAHRIVCDYIANMTDEYAYRLHERLFGLNMRTMFEKR